jgi:hypothetical protein
MVLLNVAAINDKVPGLAVTTIRATVLAIGLVLIFIPFVRSVKVGAFEVHRPDRAPPISGRSKALRSGTVLQRNALLTATSSSVPSLSGQLERSRKLGPGTDDRGVSRSKPQDPTVPEKTPARAGAVTLNKQEHEND